MNKVELSDLTNFLDQSSELILEPVLKQSSLDGWNLYFQRMDVGFPFPEFHFIVVDSEKVEMPLSRWLNILSSHGAELSKIDFRDVTSFDSIPYFTEADYECQNCAYVAHRSNFVRAKRLLERVACDEPFTDSECPKCSCLAHPVNSVNKKGLALMHFFIRRFDEALNTQPVEEACYDMSKLAVSLVSMGSLNAEEYAIEMLEEMK